jgi:hypothetical protein|tara:strand:- start:1146 stop:1955 length:810 start_codon:yes stop_codon:yes gene_type:complete
MKNVITPKKISNKDIIKFFKSKNMESVVDLSKEYRESVNDMSSDYKYRPQLKDLYRLYQIIYLNKRTTVLEFGSGYSSLMFSASLSALQTKYKNKISNLRRNNPFELFILENEKKYMGVSKRRIEEYWKNNKNLIASKINYKVSDVHMTTYNGRICTEYQSLPICNPDFIYLDGPEQFNIKGVVNDFTTAHKDLMPMVSDILKIEYFLTPGTIIVLDGRGANAAFLRDNLGRNWEYKNDTEFDQHIFYLNDPSLGVYNSEQLKFYKSKA